MANTIEMESEESSAALARFALADAPPLDLPATTRSVESLHVLTSLEELRTATETVIGSAQRLLSIVTNDLEPEIYDHPAILEAIKRFVLGHSFARVRVLMRDEARLTQGSNRFVAMAHRLTSYVELRTRAPQFQSQGATYCLADDRALLFRQRADRPEAIVGVNRPLEARQTLREFDAMWVASEQAQDRPRLARG